MQRTGIRFKFTQKNLSIVKNYKNYIKDLPAFLKYDICFVTVLNKRNLIEMHPGIFTDEMV